MYQDMFIQFETRMSETIIVNVNKILMIYATKKGATVVLDDGTPITVSESFEQVAMRLQRRELLFSPFQKQEAQ